MSVKKLNVSKPLMKCRKVTCWQKHGLRNGHVITVTDICLAGYRLTGIKGQELYTGFYLERERLLGDALINAAARVPLKDTNLAKADVGYHRSLISSQMRDAPRSVGLNHSSDEVSVMEMERRVQLIGLH